VAGEGTGGSTGGSVASSATRAESQSGGTVGGFFSELFLGTDIHRNRQAHKRHVQQKRVAWWERQAQLATIAARELAAPQRVVRRNLPGRTGPAGTGPTGQAQQQQQPRTWEDNLRDAIALALYVQQWIQDRRAARRAAGAGGGFFDWSQLAGLLGPPEADPMAYVSFTQSPGLSPGYGILNAGAATPSIWSGIGSALGQLASGALNAVAMPGGAPIPGLGTPFPTGIAAPSAGAVAIRRAPMIIAVGGRPYRSLGTPLAWSGDLAAVKRLRRAAARIGRVVPKRGGGRFR